MLGLFTPITYNTDITALFTRYINPFFAKGYSPFGSLFNSQVNYFGGIGCSYPYYNNNYYYNNCYTNALPMNYAFANNYKTSSGGNESKIASNSTTSAPSTKVTNPVKAEATKSSSKINTSRKSNENENENDLGEEFVSVARKYSNCHESDGSHLKFCNNPTCKIEDPNDEEWCTDFVTYVAKEAYRNKGLRPPAGFGNHDVRTMKNWAIYKGYFIRTTDKSQKGKFIAQNIKPGDIMIINENNYSHTGFVTKVDPDGVIHTIEGNRDDKVTEYSYSPNYPNLSGFIRLTF